MALRRAPRCTPSLRRTTVSSRAGVPSLTSHRAPVRAPCESRRSVATTSQHTTQYTVNSVDSDKILNRAYHLMNDGVNEASRRLFELYLSTEGKNDRNDPLYLKVLQSRGITLARSGKIRLATESADTIFPLFMEAANDASYCEVGFEIAHLLRRTGALTKAKETLNRTMELVSKHLGNDNLLMSNVLQLYASLEPADLKRAIVVSKKALEIKDHQLGSSEPWKLTENYYFLIRSSVRVGNMDEARDLLEVAKQRLTNIDTRAPKHIRDAAVPLATEFEGAFSFFQGDLEKAHRSFEASLDTRSRLYGEFSREIHPDLFNLHKIACARGVPHDQSQIYFLKSKYISDKFADSYDFIPPEPRDLLFLPPRDFMSYIYPAV